MKYPALEWLKAFAVGVSIGLAIVVIIYLALDMWSWIGLSIVIVIDSFYAAFRVDEIAKRNGQGFWESLGLDRDA